MLWRAAVLGFCLCTLEGVAAERVYVGRGSYLISALAGGDGCAKPLAICLHGDDATAAEFLRFWEAVPHDMPLILVAPQNQIPGWQDDDIEFLNSVITDVAQRVGFDPQRVLLIGHSAGGAMALHLFFAEHFPATAAAVTANYLPPTITPGQIARRRGANVFYAVGEADINRPRLREGLALLRDNGVSVTVERPPIGHVLSPRVAAAALHWFELTCRASVERTLAAARQRDRAQPPGQHAAELEALIRNASTHFADQIAAARTLLAELQSDGIAELARSDAWLADGQTLEARAALLRIERAYRPSSLEPEAARRRRRIERLPEVARVLSSANGADGEQAAERLWQAVQSALATPDAAAARRKCLDLVASYPQARRAEEARRLLARLDRVTLR